MRLKMKLTDWMYVLPTRLHSSSCITIQLVIACNLATTIQQRLFQFFARKRTQLIVYWIHLHGVSPLGQTRPIMEVMLALLEMVMSL